MPGPVPKRSDQRRRRNKSHVEKAVADGLNRAPELVGDHSEVAVRFWEALGRSGQAQFFQPSDWAQAELVVLAIDEFVRKPTALMFQAVTSAMSNLLVTEGDRRRLRLELEREPSGSEEDADGVTWIDDARNRLRSSG